VGRSILTVLPSIVMAYSSCATPREEIPSLSPPFLFFFSHRVDVVSSLVACALPSHAFFSFFFDAA
jgi:hypothetical protein